MEPDAGVPERLLEATVEVAAVHGLSKLSVGDVAKRAGLSRQTLYKHFGSRDELVAQAVLREAAKMVEAVIAAAEEHDDPVDSLEAAIATALAVARQHPLLDRLLATEPEALLPLLVDGRGSVQDAVELVARQMLEARLPQLGPDQVRAGSELLSRVLISYGMRPPDQPPEVVARTLTHAVLGAVLAAPGPALPFAPLHP